MDDAKKYMVANMLRIQPNEKLEHTLEKYMMLRDFHSIQTKTASMSDADILAEINRIPGKHAVT